MEDRYYDMEDKKQQIWMNKKVYIKTYNPERSYSGRVISEDETSITIIDIYGHHVRILLNNASIVQEEKERN